jgi:hypothetical protein
VKERLFNIYINEITREEGDGDGDGKRERGVDTEEIDSLTIYVQIYMSSCTVFAIFFKWFMN